MSLFTSCEEKKLKLNFNHCPIIGKLLKDSHHITFPTDPKNVSSVLFHALRKPSFKYSINCLEAHPKSLMNRVSSTQESEFSNYDVITELQSIPYPLSPCLISEKAQLFDTPQPTNHKSISRAYENA